MNHTNAHQRNYGIDLLRMVSMFMIVILHSLGHGGVLNSLKAGSVHYNAAWLLETAAYCAVNCFALVSGYVGLRSRFKVSNIVMLWLQVVFYNAAFTVIGAAAKNEPLGLGMLASAFLPAKGNAYWYFTAYLGMFFFTPFMNAAVEHMQKRQLQLALLGIVALFSVYVTAANVDIFKVSKGYHVLWLMVIYMIGAYISKYGFLERMPKLVWLPVYIGAVLLSWAVLLLNNHLKIAEPQGNFYFINLIQYTSPTILLAAVSLLMLFSKIRMAAWLEKIISKLSPLAFGVYLIHDSVFVRSNLISNRLAGLANASVWGMLGKVILFALAVYCVCSLIDFVRSAVFKVLRIRSGIEFLEKRLIPKE